MSLKAELETWAAALKAYDEEDFEQSLELFLVCPRSPPPSLSVSPSLAGHCRLVKNSHKYGPYLRNSRRA
jgi:hypothetical protein